MDFLKEYKISNYIEIQGLCRLCLSVTHDNSYVPIFKSQDPQTTTMKTRIEACISLEVMENDGLPPNICSSCAVKLTDWYEFKLVAKQSDTNLRQCTLIQPEVVDFNISKVKVSPSSLCGDNNSLYADTVYSDSADVPQSDSADIPEEVNDEDSKTGLLEINCDTESNRDAMSEEDEKPLIELAKTIKLSKSQDGQSKKRRISNRGRLPKEKPYCSKCDTKFSRFPEFYSHMEEVHNEPQPEVQRQSAANKDSFSIFRCHVCKDDFYDRSSLRSHCKDAHNVKIIQPYGCSHCDRQFPSWGLLVVHERQHTGVKPYDCDLCGKKNFVSDASLRRHKLMHYKVYHCKECERTFNCDSALKAHYRCKHTNEKPFLCSVCGRSFSLATILNAHMTSHSTERRFHCEICGFASKTSGNHHRHKARHNQDTEKNFHCESCGKAFSTKLKLSAHQVIHRPVRPHVCNVCGKGFLYNNKLDRHILLVHAKERPHPCHLCGKKLASRFGLKIHLNTHARAEAQAQNSIKEEAVEGKTENPEMPNIPMQEVRLLLP